MRKCKQEQCIFLKMKNGCKKCGDCSAPSFLVAQDCLRCSDCENKPGSCRWDDKLDNNIEDNKDIKIIKVNN